MHDRGSQFADSFDEVFRTAGIKVFKTPVRTPVANSIAERWIGTLRRELLDRTIIWNRRQPHRLVVDYIDHYNAHRPSPGASATRPGPAASATRREHLTDSQRDPAPPLRRPHQRVQEHRMTPRPGFRHPHVHRVTFRTVLCRCVHGIGLRRNGWCRPVSPCCVTSVSEL